MNNNQVQILLAEDNHDDAEFILRILKKLNLQDKTIHVSNGEEALEILFPDISQKIKPLTPVLILLDIKMPKVDGLKVLEKIKTHPETKIIPVVILTSSNIEKDIKAAYLLGANGYVVKPMDYDYFIQTIESLIHFWININKSPFQMK